MCLNKSLHHSCVIQPSGCHYSITDFVEIMYTDVVWCRNCRTYAGELACGDEDIVYTLWSTIPPLVDGAMSGSSARIRSQSRIEEDRGTAYMDVLGHIRLDEFGFGFGECIRDVCILSQRPWRLEQSSHWHQTHWLTACFPTRIKDSYF